MPFLISAVLLLVGYFIRVGVNESPDFAQVLERQERAEIPAKEVLRTAWRTVLLCMGVCTVAIGGIYFTNTFMLSYTTQTMGLSRTLILDCLFVVAIIPVSYTHLDVYKRQPLDAAHDTTCTTDGRSTFIRCVSSPRRRS